MVRTKVLGITTAAFIAAGIACGGDGKGGGGGGGDGGPVETDLVVRGKVLLASSGGGQGSPISGATVRMTLDRNGDRVIAGDEEIIGETDGEGMYRVQVAVPAGQTVVVGYHEDGAASLYRTFVAGPKAEVVENVTLQPMENLTCENGRCTVQSGSISIAGLADGISAAGRVFNPVTEAASFPGGFGDADGNLLISGVFSAVELTDSSGDRLEQLDEPVELRMKMPRDTWGVVVDIEPGTDRIDVPLYSFDETLGTWVRDGSGHLEDANGRILEESTLASIRDGSFEGSVVSAGSVTHFSYWNVDWPVEAHACVSGTVLDGDGNPAEGATVVVSGVSYNGSSTPQTVGPDGRFCVDVMRSEGPGDDVDQDGVNGETHRVGIRIVHRGRFFDGGEFDTPATQGTCADGDCLDLGTISLTTANELTAAICTIRGRVLHPDGTPVPPNTPVYAYDETLPEELFVALCGQSFENCSFYTYTDAEGRFEARAPVLDSVSLYSTETQELEPGVSRYLWGVRTIRGCPAAEVELTLDQGYTTYLLTVTLTGGTIAWNFIDATYVTVASADGQPKWLVTGAEIGSPVTYGTVPAGAAQAIPQEGTAPPALASGDRVGVLATGADAAGVTYYGTGEVTVP